MSDIEKAVQLPGSVIFPDNIALQQFRSLVQLLKKKSIHYVIMNYTLHTVYKPRHPKIFWSGFWPVTIMASRSTCPSSCPAGVKCEHGHLPYFRIYWINSDIIRIYESIIVIVCHNLSDIWLSDQTYLGLSPIPIRPDLSTYLISYPSDLPGPLKAFPTPSNLFF